MRLVGWQGSTASELALMHVDAGAWNVVHVWLTCCRRHADAPLRRLFRAACGQLLRATLPVLMWLQQLRL